jgi:hypothetical protein
MAAERSHWPIHLTGVTLMAVILAVSMSAAVGIKVKGLLGADGNKRAVASGDRDAVITRDFHEASLRNIFGLPVVVGDDAFSEAAAPPPEEEKEDEPISDELVPTELPLGLVGTSVFSEPSFSLASIVDLNERKAGSEIYALKDCGDPVDPPCNALPGGAELRTIEVERVIIFNPDEKRLEELRLDGEKKQGTKKSVSKPPKYLPKPDKKPKPEPKDHGFEIRKVGANSYEIPRDNVGKALGQMASLARDARVVPVGEGFKLAWIRKGSVFESIGVQRGDIIKSANGYDVTSMEGAMQAFGKLKSASDISIDLLRGGSKVTLEYRVVD